MNFKCWGDGIWENWGLIGITSTSILYEKPVLYVFKLKYIENTLKYKKYTLNYMKNTYKYIKNTLNYIRNTLNDIVNQHIINDFNQNFILALINMLKMFTEIIKDLS